MKGLVCLLLLLETFVCVVQHQVDGGLNENEISQQLRSEDGRQHPPQTDTLRDEASTDSQQNYHLFFTDIHAALRELTATVTEQKVNIRELTATVTEQKVNIRELTANIRALETRLREEMNKKNDEMSNLTLTQVEELRKENRDREIAFSASLMQSGSGNIGPFTSEITLTYRNVFTNIGNAYNPITGVFTAPLKGVYMFRISVHGVAPTPSAASIYKNGERVVVAYDAQAQDRLNSSNGVVLILEVGDVVYTRQVIVQTVVQRSSPSGFSSEQTADNGTDNGKGSSHSGFSPEQTADNGTGNGKRSSHSGFSPEQAAAGNGTDSGKRSSHSSFSPEQTADNGTGNGKRSSHSGFSPEQAAAGNGTDSGKRSSHSSFSSEQTAADHGTNDGKRPSHSGFSSERTTAGNGTDCGKRPSHSGLSSEQTADNGTGNGKRSTHSSFSSEQSAADHGTDNGKGSSHSGFSSEQAAADDGTDSGKRSSHSGFSPEQTADNGTGNGKRSSHSSFSSEQTAADHGTNDGKRPSHSGFTPEQAAAGNGTDSGKRSSHSSFSSEQTAADHGTNDGKRPSHSGFSSEQTADNGTGNGKRSTHSSFSSEQSAADHRTTVVRDLHTAASLQSRQQQTMEQAVHQVDGGLNENEISQQLRSEDGRQNPPQTDTLRDEASTDSQQNYHLFFTDIHAALRELTATVTEQKGNIRELTATVTEQKVNIRELTATVTEQKVNIRELTANIRALETRLREEMNKKNDEMSNLTLTQVEELRKENRDREIAFSASLMQSGSGNIGPFTSEITLTYRNVFTNIGNAYNPITGVFTAPLKGAYMFRISVFGIGPTPAAAAIYKNGERVVIASAHQAKDRLNASNGVVLILEVGDVVYRAPSHRGRAHQCITVRVYLIFCERVRLFSIYQHHGLGEMSEFHEEVKLLLAVVHKQAQEHLSQFQLLVFVSVVETG
ncbi:unnamed protein product [Leuciscus chuanchicus]